MKTKIMIIGLTFCLTGLAHADPIALNPDTPTGEVIGWNEAVWGDPPSAPSSGNDYIHNQSNVFLGALGGQVYGPFQGSSLTLGPSGEIWLYGGGSLGGTLILDGGRIQNRFGATAIVLGSIRVESNSRILNVSGNLELRSGLSGAGNLQISAFQNPGLVMVNATDTGYSGTFELRNAGADNVTLNVRFDRSYQAASLTFQGGQPLRAPVYRLTNDISFLSVRMPSADNPSVLLTLPEGAYDGQALTDAGVHPAYFEDLGGTIIVLQSADLIRIHSSIPSETHIGWNEPIWGDPPVEPSAGNDYINDRVVWLGALGGQAYGPFEGDSLTLRGSGEIWLAGGGPLGGTLILDGGRIQNRFGGTAIVLGSIRVESNSRYLNVSGNLELRTGISGSGNLQFKTFLNSCEVLMNTVDTGFIGALEFTNSDANGARLTVQFDSSFPDAHLIIVGGNLSRGSIYRLQNDIAFNKASFPSAEHASIMIDLDPGIYDGAALLAAGVNPSYFDDQGGTINVGPVALFATFDEWREEHFAEHLEDPAISGPDADPSGSGLKNLVAYALNLDPWSPASRADLPFMDSDNGDGFVLVFRERTDVGDISYIPEVSENLILWMSGEPHIELIAGEENGGFRQMAARANLSGDVPKLFMRLTVQLAE